MSRNTLLNCRNHVRAIRGMLFYVIAVYKLDVLGCADLRTSCSRRRHSGTETWALGTKTWELGTGHSLVCWKWGSMGKEREANFGGLSQALVADILQP